MKPIVKCKIYHVQWWDRVGQKWATVSQHYFQIDAMIELGKQLDNDGDNIRYRVIQQASPVVLIETKTPDYERNERPEESI